MIKIESPPQSNRSVVKLEPNNPFEPPQTIESYRSVIKLDTNRSVVQIEKFTQDSYRSVVKMDDSPRSIIKVKSVDHMQAFTNVEVMNPV